MTNCGILSIADRFHPSIDIWILAFEVFKTYSTRLIDRVHHGSKLGQANHDLFDGQVEFVIVG